LLEVHAPAAWSSRLREFWHECVFDFYRKDLALEHGTQHFATYGCHNFTADRRCSRDGLRPVVCRAYPALALSDRPVVRAHCGLQVVDD
jgi:Fe-S-cluster containining protein